MSPRRVLAWIGVLLLAVLPAYLRDAAPEPERSPFRRMLGPIASAAASVQWVRVDLALRAGRLDLALARAENALRLDPGATEGWMYLGRHLAFDRASVAREPDPARRRAWIEAGLDLARRGIETAREPEELHLWRALVLVKVVETDEELPWPGGAEAMLEEAARACDRAAELGQPDAAEIGVSVRRRLRARRGG